MERLDRPSILALQLKAPGACEKEARGLEFRINSDEILTRLTALEKKEIWDKLCKATVDCLVPSLYSFFEDLKYLADASLCFRWLLDLDRGETIRCALKKAYRSQICLVQTSKLAFESIASNETDHFDIAYRQLWLFARRECQDMPVNPKQKLAKKTAVQADEMVLFRFASLAHKLGFRTEKISMLLHRNPDREIARRLLTTARRPDQYIYDDIESSITAITNVLEAAQPLGSDNRVHESAAMSNENDTPTRCGRPRASHQAQDKSLMFLDKIHSEIPRFTSTVSSFFVQRSTYFAFFGKNIAISVDDLLTASGENSNEWSFVNADNTHRDTANTVWQDCSEDRALQQKEREVTDRLELLISEKQKKSCRVGRSTESSLNQLASFAKSCPTDEEAGETERLVNLTAQLCEKHNQLNQLESEEREKRIAVQKLEESEKRLLAAVDELNAKTRILSVEEKARNSSIAVVEEQHRGVVEKLTQKELDLRQTIDSLEVCLERHQAMTRNVTKHELSSITRPQTTTNGPAREDKEEVMSTSKVLGKNTPVIKEPPQKRNKIC